VVERGLADEVDLDATVEAFHRADEHVVGVVVGRRAGVRCDGVLVVARTQRQRISYDDPARRGLPRRLEDLRPGYVRPGRRVRDPERSEAEEARLAVEQAAEDARSVETRDG